MYSDAFASPIIRALLSPAVMTGTWNMSLLLNELEQDDRNPVRENKHLLFSSEGTRRMDHFACTKTQRHDVSHTSRDV